jgi:3-phenylpropionate/trans-cinnamate dioxygenase ferredoxin reductase component
MNRYKYLIAGGGMAADAAVQGIREADQNGSIGVLSSDIDPPYRRPPLSKDLWYGEMSIEEIDCNTSAHDVTVLTGRTVKSLNPAQKTVTDQDRVYGYDKLLLATGGRPRQLPFDAGSERVNCYRTLNDYRLLIRQTAENDRFALIGGGFIGCELAAALVSKRKQVTIIFPESAPCGRILPEQVSTELANCFEQKGIRLFPGLKVSDMQCDDRGCDLVLENGRNLQVDSVLIGIGIKPNEELAAEAGLETGDGIVVNRNLQTTDPDIYAAGDVIRFYNPALDTTLRVEHEDHARVSGKTAGRNMTGATEPYDHLPLFYSDLFDIGYEAVGELDSSLDTEGIWNGLHEKGIQLYLNRGRIRGVLLWNLFGQVDKARALIAHREPLPPESRREKLNQILQAD